MGLKAKIVLEQHVGQYNRPKRGLEQYRTPPEIAVEVSQLVNRLCDGQVVVDQGAGTGMLSYAISLIAPRYVVGLEIDGDAVSVARGSELWRLLAGIDFIVADVRYPPLRRADCVVQNPPFGIHQRGMDRMFLEKGLGYRPKAIVSIHRFNEASARLLRELCTKEGYSAEIVAKYWFPLPAMYETHRSKVYYVQVFVLACWEV